MYSRSRLSPLACALLLFSMFLLPPGSARAGVIRSDLENHLSAISDGTMVSIIVYLTEQADIASIDTQLRKTRASRQARHEKVVRALKEASARSQAPILACLAGAVKRGDATGFTPYWISNIVIVEATKGEVHRLESRPDVGFIEPNFTFSKTDPVAAGTGGPHPTGIGVTPGIKAINADRVWRELGITGAGRLVANLDTGVDGNHPALASRWRGTLPGVRPSAAWLDLVYGGSQFPVDYNSHGTHVMGTMTGLGEASGDSIGVALGAYWIACNAIDQNAGPEFDNDVIHAFQWFADPDSNPATVDDVPDVVENSWRVNEYFGGYVDCDSRWNSVIDNCEAAGVVVMFSAGGEGPGSQTIGSPADRADTPFNCFSIGAVDASNYGYPYPIASFSSRGPSGCDSVSIKPEVCAPGVDIYSSVPGGGYQGGWSGTSMAGPHVAGVVALMREANPDLTVDQIKHALMATAHDFGSPDEDNTYGMGFIDAYDAVIMVMSGIGTLTGTVTDALTGDPIAADIEIAGTTRRTTADPATGEYSFILPGDSTYTLQVTYFGYDTAQQVIYVVPDDTTIVDFLLSSSPSGTLAGLVMNREDGLPLSGAIVEIMGTPINTKTTGALGLYNFSAVPGGASYTVQSRADGYGPNTEKKQVASGALNLLALPLTSGFSDDMENGLNGWTDYSVTSGYADQWHQTTQRNNTAGGSTSWKCGATGGGGYADYMDAGLVTPTLTLMGSSRLLFSHWIDAEISSGSEAWDGAIVEISIDGGSFEQITPGGGYPYTIGDNPDSPFDPGTPCFSGSHDWKQEEFDLTGYSGSAEIRFRFGSDGYVGQEGWYIDDVVIAPDTPTQPVSIMLLPENANIELGPLGGTFSYTLALVNNTNETQVFTWWIDIMHQTGYVYGPVKTSTDTLNPLEAVMIPDNVQEIPYWVPPATYNYNGKLGIFPDIVKSISSFHFSKTENGPATGSRIEAWSLEVGTDRR